MPQRNSVIAQGFVGLRGVAALFCSLRGLFQPADSCSARVKGHSASPLEQVRTCFCARCDVGFRADTRTPSHQEQWTFGGTQRTTHSPECAPSWPKLKLGAIRTTRGYVKIVCWQQNAQVWTRNSRNQRSAMFASPYLRLCVTL